MKSTVTLLVLGLSASVALADNARPRSGDTGSSSSAGARHHGGSVSSGGSSRSSGGSLAVGEDRSSGSTDLTPAQARRPRPGTGTGYRRGGSYRGGSYGGGYYGGGYYGGYFGYPYYSWYPRTSIHLGYYSPFWYDDYYYGYYGYGGRPHYRGSYYDDHASVRIQVQPEKAKVYVDGYYAGVVDDFNGLFQRLNLSPGRHEITVKMDGYRTHTWRLYAPPGQTIKIQHDLAKGSGEDPIDELSGRPVAYERLRDEPREERRDEPAVAPGERVGGEAGRLRLDFRPDDATLYIDGEFRGTARDIRFVDLRPGLHRVEVVRPGYVTYEREIDVRAGENPDLRVDLERR